MPQALLQVYPTGRLYSLGAEPVGCYIIPLMNLQYENKPSLFTSSCYSIFGAIHVYFAAMVHNTNWAHAGSSLYIYIVAKCMGE